MPYCFICNEWHGILLDHFEDDKHKENRNPSIIPIYYSTYRKLKWYHKIDEFIK